MQTLSLEHISHSYGANGGHGEITAVKDVGLTVAPGEVICLVGPSGCGKSTLLRVAAGLEPLQAGKVRIGDKLVGAKGVNVAPENRGVGLVFQDFALFPHLDVLANVAFGLSEMDPGPRKVAAAAILDRVGMSDHGAAFPHELSGGQQQRVALARALAPSPAVMLLDEPFSGLDTRLRDKVRDQSLHILKDSGAATLIVTHDSEEAMFMADRIAVMRHGAIEQIGVPSELYFSPSNAFVTEFFSEVNKFTGAVSQGKVLTPLGPIAADKFGDGTSVDVLVRPEAVRIAEVGAGAVTGAITTATACVEAARLLGRTSLIHLSVQPPAGSDNRSCADGAAAPSTMHLHARVPGQQLPSPGTRVSLELDHSLAFVFPTNGAT